MAKKTDVVTQDKPEVTEEKKIEQAPRDFSLNCKIERVAFSIVDKLEENANAGFCVEMLNSPDLGSPLYRLCHEVLKGDIDKLPEAITPFVTASQLVDLVSGAVILQPMLIKIVKDLQKNVELEDPVPHAS